MPRTPSTMVPLGTPQPAFTLPDPTGRTFTSEGCRGPRGTLVMFLCNHCPFVHHVADTIASVAEEAQGAGFGVVGIMSNDFLSHPEDAPERMGDCAAGWNWSFPYLVDETQEVAAAHQAACTPDFFLFDARGRLAYRGQLDESRPGNGIISDGRDLRAALAALAAGGSPAAEQIPSLGCNIKWKPQRAPA